MKNSKQGFYQKNMALVYIVVLVLGTVASFAIPKQESASAGATVMIPEEAIRLRILANSDSEADQAVKRAIRDEVNAEITNWVQDLTSVDAARDVITSQLEAVEEIAKQELALMGLDYSVKVEFGKNVQFPTKLYGQFLYPAGTYEAILITLGEGSGANWWCVLFPPLCFLDFSNGLAVGPGFDEAKADEKVIDPEDAEIEPKQEIAEAEVKDEELTIKQDTVEVEPKNEETVIEQKKTVEKNTSVDKQMKDVDNPTMNEESNQQDLNSPIIVDDEQEVEVRFFLADLFKKMF